jgi:uncharacterized protein (DUF2062 family)
VIFKRRDAVGWLAWLREMIYPRGGFRRAVRYVMHRMRRLPDSPHRIARGVFAGSFIGFLPLPGVQFLGAWAFARLIRGNVLASLLATFNSNPITTPFFAVGAISLGHWMMGGNTPLTQEAIGAAFGNAGAELWSNFKAIFTHEVAHWDGLAVFWRQIYLPYFIGAMGPGIVLSLVGYYLTIPLVGAYQKARAAKSAERGERRAKLAATFRDAAQRLKPKSKRDGGGDGDADVP